MLSKKELTSLRSYFLGKGKSGKLLTEKNNLIRKLNEIISIEQEKLYPELIKKYTYYLLNLVT